MDQLTSEVELIIVDGASTDNTSEVIATYRSRFPKIRYIRELANSGIDADYDKAVGYATGKYCWLMTDDDLLKPGAVKRVLAELDGVRDLIVVNAETKNANLTEILAEKQLVIDDDRLYTISDYEVFFRECCNYLSFIGGVVICREYWMGRDRESFYGTLFIHVGVIFQQPLIKSVYLISDPQIIIRYGNAMWTPRGFEIWSFKWPELVWSFNGLSDEVKLSVCNPAPWKKIKRLLYYRAIGAYSMDDFIKFIYPRTSGVKRYISLSVANFPAALANLILVFYVKLFTRKNRINQYDLLRSQHASRLSHFLNKTFWK